MSYEESRPAVKLSDGRVNNRTNARPDRSKAKF